jgi:hypothetical protein
MQFHLTACGLTARSCHDHLHALFDEKTLEREYNTLEFLETHPERPTFRRLDSQKNR